MEYHELSDAFFWAMVDEAVRVRQLFCDNKDVFMMYCGY